jgi:sarcosine oxidase subunit alpha
LLERLWAHAAPSTRSLWHRGLEILRTEKGFIHIGTDTDGTTLPGDIGLARGVDRKRANFVGRRSLLRPRRAIPRVCNWWPCRPPMAGRAAGGRQIAAAPPPTLTEGHVTSSYMSPELGAPVALGMLSRGFAARGRTGASASLGIDHRSRGGEGAVAALRN